jgi:hypothetical protein
MEDNRIMQLSSDPSSSNVTTRAPPVKAEIACGRADETVSDLQVGLEEASTPLPAGGRAERTYASSEQLFPCTTAGRPSLLDRNVDEAQGRVSTGMESTAGVVHTDSGRLDGDLNTCLT